MSTFSTPENYAILRRLRTETLHAIITDINDSIDDDIDANDRGEDIEAPEDELLEFQQDAQIMLASKMALKCSPLKRDEAPLMIS